MQSASHYRPPDPILLLSSHNSYTHTPSLSHDDPDMDFPSSGDSMSQSPPARMLMDEYTKPALHLDTADSLKPSVLRRSSTLYLDDPVATHLLVETAIGDSQDYKVLSFDELHLLKKDQDAVSRRLQALRRNLHLETKVRNAAQSLGRLQSRSTGSASVDPFSTDHSSQVEAEAATSNRKCEQMAQEIWHLEKRQAQLHDKQLQHTAGILHMENRYRTQDAPPPQRSRDGISAHELAHGYEAAMLTPEAYLDHADGSAAQRSLQNDELISSTTNKLQQLQERLRDLISLTSSSLQSPNGHQNPEPPLPVSTSGSIDDSIGNLEASFKVLADKVEAQQSRLEAASSVEGKLQMLNEQIFGIISSSRAQIQPPFPPPPAPLSTSGNATRYLEDGLHKITLANKAMSEALENEQTRQQALHDQNVETHTTMIGLWEMLTASEEDARRRQLGTDAYDAAESARNVPSTEPFSTEAFSAKVQSLCTRITDLSDQHTVLRQQITQQREARSGQETQHETMQRDLLDAQDQHVADQRLLEEATASLAARNTEHESVLANLAELRSVHEGVQAKAASLQLSNDDHVANLAALQATHDGVLAQSATLQAAHDEQARSLSTLQAAHTEHEATVARLQTELTVARAELDAMAGAKTEQAANSARVAVLERELKELVGEYEGMIKISVEGEREREGLEGTIDTLRDKVESLEVSLNEQRVLNMARRSSTADAPNVKDQTSTTVMRNEFKKMMREARAEHFRHLKYEQEERRKLEALVRAMRKEQTTSLIKGSSLTPLASPPPHTQLTPPKSGLSNSVSAS